MKVYSENFGFYKKDRATTITYIILSMCNSICAPGTTPSVRLSLRICLQIIFKMLTAELSRLRKESGRPIREKEIKAY